MKKKLNAVMVSGLTIGPVLGSGIIFLPPLAFAEVGENAINAWLIVMALGALFAYVFTKMSVVVPNSQGISAIVGDVLGKPFRDLSANYLTAAVLFGPVVVALTAAEFLEPLLAKSTGVNQAMIAAGVLIICALLVISGVAFMAKVMLVLSSLTACFLLVGSLAHTAQRARNKLSPCVTEFCQFRACPAVNFLVCFWLGGCWEITSKRWTIRRALCCGPCASAWPASCRFIS